MLTCTICGLSYENSNNLSLHMRQCEFLQKNQVEIDSSVNFLFNTNPKQCTTARSLGKKKFRRKKGSCQNSKNILNNDRKQCSQENKPYDCEIRCHDIENDDSGYFFLLSLKNRNFLDGYNYNNTLKKSNILGGNFGINNNTSKNGRPVEKNQSQPRRSSTRKTLSSNRNGPFDFHSITKSSYEKREILWKDFESKALSAKNQSISYQSIPFLMPEQKGLELLGIQQDSNLKDDDEEIRSRLRINMRRWHPDKFLQMFGSKIKTEDKERTMNKVIECSQRVNALKDYLK